MTPANSNESRQSRLTVSLGRYRLGQAHRARHQGGKSSVTDLPILGADVWRNNAELIDDVRRLHIADDAVVLDVTYGRGIWWRRWTPANLTAHDLRLDGVDFRCLPEMNDSFDVVAFDPPYVMVGGRSTSTLPDFNDRYGLHTTQRTPAELDALMAAGLAEAHRVVRPRGLILAKCADYIWSGRYHAGTHHLLDAALDLGLVLVDRFDMVTLSPRPQPGGRRIVHARRNSSTLFVLRKAAR
jgi:hypothetical protein